MAAGSVQSRFTTEELIAALEQLAPADVERVSRRLFHLLARRRATNLAAREGELLQDVCRDHRPGFRERFDELNVKRCAHTPTTTEHEELLRLVDEFEAFAARRLGALSELAHLHQLTLPALTKQLGLQTPAVE